MANVDPGEGWRLLENGEELCWGDECLVVRDGEDKWVKTSLPGKRVGMAIGTQHVYRRPILNPTTFGPVGSVEMSVGGLSLGRAEEIQVTKKRGKVYIAGKMRGVRLYNFPEFDRVGGLLLNAGFEVVSPADLDRAHGFDPWELPESHDWSSTPEGFDLKAAFHRDIQALADCTHILLLDGWTGSVGARCEYFAAKWLGLRFVFAEVDGSVWELGPGWEPVCPVETPAREQASYLANCYWDSIVAAPEDDAKVESILDEAKRITGGDRQAQYGPPDQDFRRTAAMWTGLFADLLKDGARFEPFHVALAMILLKASRQMHQRKRDNWCDMAGYSHCGNVCDEQAVKKDGV